MENRFYQARSQVLECLQHGSQRQEMLRYALGLADMILGEWETGILQDAIDALKVAVDRGHMAGLRLRNVSRPMLPNRPPPPQQTLPPPPPPPPQETPPPPPPPQHEMGGDGVGWDGTVWDGMGR